MDQPGYQWVASLPAEPERMKLPKLAHSTFDWNQIPFEPIAPYQFFRGVHFHTAHITDRITVVRGPLKICVWGIYCMGSS